MCGKISPFRKQTLRYYSFALDVWNRTLADILLCTDTNNELSQSIRFLALNGIVFPELFANVSRLTVIKKHQIKLIREKNSIKKIEVIPTAEQNKKIEKTYGIEIKRIEIPTTYDGRFFILPKSEIEFGAFIEFASTIQFILVVSSIIDPY